MAGSTMRLSGINSGFDTEAMIQQMMSTYQNKIDTQSKKLQTLQWKQEQYRDITSKLTTFKNKYFDILKRDTYLMSPTTFKKMKTTIATKSGKDSGLKVTASSDATPGSHTLKVNSLATAAVTKGGQVAGGRFKLDVDRAMENSLPNEDGKYNFSLDVKVGNVARTIEFSGADKDELLSSLNYELEDAFGTTSGGAAFISAELKDGEFAFKTSGNSMATVTERTGNFGMNKPAEKVAIDTAAALTGKSSISVTIPNYYTGEAITKNVEFDTVSSTYYNSSDATIQNEFKQLKAIAFTKKYNVNLADVTEDMMKNAGFNYSAADAASDVNSANLVSALNGAYGMSQGVTFAINGSSVIAKYTGSQMDGSAVEFTMTSTCDATFGLKKGSATSYLDESTKLSDLGIAPDAHYDDGDFYTMSINGKEIKVDAKATVKDLISAVNKSGAGVTLAYSKLEGAFTLTANDKGTGADIRVGDNALAAALGLTDSTMASHTDGTNATLVIDGITVEHNDNVYELDGVKYDFADVDPTDNDTITVSVAKDNDSVVDLLKGFVEEYNKLIDDINEYTKTARPTDKKQNYYEPLTDEEKEDMDDKEIEKWEIAAKKGLLYHDTTVMGVMSKIKTALASYVTLEDGSKFGLASMGIKTASYLNSSMEDVKDGKLVLDEDRLRKVLEERPDAVEKLFTDATNGVMAKTKNAFESAVKEGTTSATSGTLIRKAGTEKGTSAKTNAIYKEMERIQKRMERLQTQYEKKEDYWWKVFTNLEKMQAQFDSQQNYISQFTANGGYLS